MKTLYHECYLGLGDNIYERPFVVEMAKRYDRVYVETPFPQLYWDQDPNKFYFVPRKSNLHTQTRNIKTSGCEHTRWWTEYPKIEGGYCVSCFWRPEVGYPGNVVSRRQDEFDMKNIDMTLPVAPWWIADARRMVPKDRRICIVKRPTIRTEWLCTARNPKIEYFQQAINLLSVEDYCFISIADIRGNDECLDGDLTGIDIHYHRGEIDIWCALGLIAIANLTICTQSFAVPFALATRSRCFAIYGGYGRPERYIYPSLNFGYAAPDPFCDCQTMQHNCNKTIHDFDKKFTDYLYWRKGKTR